MKKSTTSKLLTGAFALLLIVAASCKKDQANPALNSNNIKSSSISASAKITGSYANGFFIINEGWFAHGTGSVSFYNYATQQIQDSVFTNLNPVTSTLEYGTIFNNQMFLVSKVGGPVVVTDPNTMVEIARIAAASGNNWQAFVGVTAAKGLLSSATGVFPFNLTTYTTGAKLTTVTGNVADMIKAGNYVFVLSQTKGVVILNVADYSAAKTIAGMTVAFAQTPDGSVWAAGGTSLIKINSATLAVTTITVPFTVNGSWAAWHPGSITASTTENSIFLADNGTETGATAIYKYIDGNAASLSAPFISVAAGKELYGAGVGYNTTTNQLVVNTVRSGFGTNFGFNDLDFYNATTGALLKDIPFSGYYFPATYVFH
jgi:Domain of unknown function (DUF5074)